MRPLFGVLCLSVVLVGCGGSGGGTSVPPAPAEPIAEKGTALFDVDVASGKVKIQPLETAKGKSSVLSGNAVSFETTTLLSEGGEVGRRAIKIRLKNNLSEAIGVGRPIRLQFGVIGPVTSYPTDLSYESIVSSPIRDSGSGFADGPVSSAHISFPAAVTVGQDGAIYFSGTDNRVRRLQDGYVSTVAQNVPTAGLTYLKDPSSGREYLIAGCPSLHSVKLIPIASGSVSTWAGLDSTSGNVNGAAGTARFNGPRGVAVDASSNQVLVADTDNGAVRAIPYSFSGGNLVAGTVLTRYSGLATPRYVAVSTNRTVGVSEFSANRIRLFNAGSSKEAIIGTGTAGDVMGDGNLAQFNHPQGITTLGDTFFVSDTTNHHIKRIVLKNGAAPLLAANWSVALIAGAGTSGFADGPGATAIFGNIVQISTDSQGRILAGDDGANGIRRIVSQGSFDFGTPDGTGVGQAALANPTGFVDLNGLQRPYIDLAQRVEPGQTVDAGDWQFTIPPGVSAFRFAVTVEAGTSVYSPLEAVLNGSYGPGSPNVVAQFLSRSSPSGATTGKINSVTFDPTTSSCAYDSAGNLFVTDYAYGTIRRIALDGSVTFVAGKTFTQSEADGSGSNARFYFPGGIMVNPQGTEIIVADFGGKTIRRIALNYDGADPALADNWTVSTIAGADGQSGDADGPGGTSRFRGPFALAGPNNDSIYVGESQGARIRLVRYIGGPRNLSSSWDVLLVAGSSTGLAGFVDGSGSSALFTGIFGLAYSAAGNLYVSDSSNHRVRMVNLNNYAVTTVAGSGSSSYSDNDNATSAGVTSPTGIATDASGAVYFFDGAIRRLLNGGVRTVAGGGNGSGTTGDLLLLGQVYGMALTPQGDLTGITNKRLFRLTRKLGR